MSIQQAAAAAAAAASSYSKMLLQMVYLWALFVCLYLLFAFFARRVVFLYALRDIPSPQALPIIGNALQLHCSLEEFFNKLIKWGEKFGNIYLLWVGIRPFIFLYRAESVHALLNNSQHIDKSFEYGYLKPWLGNGLIVSSGEKWRARRKLLTPTFHSELLKNYFTVVLRQADIFVSCLESELSTSGGFDIIPYAKRAALDIICECAMGYNINSQTNYEDEYVAAVQRLTTITQKRFTNIWIASDFVFKRTSLGRKQDRALKVIHNLVDQVITERKVERGVWRNESQRGDDCKASKKPETLLDLLLQMSEDRSQQLTDDDIREEVNTFMFAGHDTVGTSVSWILYALGRNPRYQDKIVEECEEAMRAAGERDHISYNTLKKLVWLDVCVKEAWRMYPVSPLIARQINSPLKIPIVGIEKGCEVPAGSTILVNSYLLHRDPRFFPEPELYRPERFLNWKQQQQQQQGGYHNFAYIPFSAGSRNCIGAKFATMEVHLTLLALLRAYRFHAKQTEQQLRFVSQIVLDNVGGIPLSISEREKC